MGEDLGNHGGIFDACPEPVEGAVMIFKVPPQWGSGFGVPHPVLGQAIIGVVTPVVAGGALNCGQLIEECKRRLPAFMVPDHIALRDALPRNPNGKTDRERLTGEFAGYFAATC